MQNKLFEWNEENIGWFEASSKYSKFHENLASLISPILDNNSTVIDVGAGLGRLDQYIRDHCRQMILVEPNKYAYNYLVENKKENQMLFNMTFEEYLELNREPCDYLLLSFFSRMEMEDNLERLSSLCKKKIIYVRNENHDSNDTLIEYLNDKGAEFKYFHREIDFSQPLKKDDVDKFIETYYGSKSKSKKQKMRDSIINEGDHCIYKNTKQISIFIIEKFNKEEL